MCSICWQCGTVRNCAAFNQYLLPAGPTAANLLNRQTDRRTTYGWIDLGWQVVFDQTIWSSWEFHYYHKGKGSPYSITERRVPELIPVLSSQPAGDVSHKPRSKLPLLSARPAITSTTLKTAATSFAALWTETQWVWTVCLRLLPDSITAAIWTRALLRLSPAC